jgi:uncharacterized protein YciI
MEACDHEPARGDVLPLCSRRGGSPLRPLPSIAGTLLRRLRGSHVFRRPVDAIRPAHVEHLERHAREGVFRAWARRDPPAGGVLVAAAPDRATLEAIVAKDPYVRAGVARAELVEFNASNVRGVLST